MSKIIEFDINARRKLTEGMNLLAQSVIITFGPKGRTVVFEKVNGEPQVCNDGVTVARQVELDDPVEDLGAKMLRQAAIKTSETAGDGTTSATLLAQAMINIGLKRIEAGINPMEVRRGISKAVKAVVDHLKKQSVSVGDDHSKIEQVASISANNDGEIGKLIAEAVRKAGKESVITIEEAKGIETSIEVVEGLRFDRGYISPYFITENEKMEVVFERPYILLHDKKVSGIRELLPLLEKVTQTGAPFLIIAEDFASDVLATLVVNNLRGVLKVAAVKAPGFGDRRKDQLEDIAFLTGGTVFSEEKGFELDKAELSHLGVCEKIIINKDNTTLINGSGQKENIEKRIKQLKAEIVKAATSFEKDQLQERMAKLTGGVAVIYVGASTEVEMVEKKDRVEDALNATRAAIEEGIVPGGGVSYLRSISSLDELSPENEEEKFGIYVVKKSLEEPIKQLAVNAGLDSNEILQRVKDGENDFGFNFKTEQFEQLLKTGVIDPTKVGRLALENAASVAMMMLTTECVIAKNRSKENETLDTLPQI
ncbi:chaperonin GroEL [Cyclobacterium jeungdonense]|uniref:Chaperonin GroEL n=1 Tax=Cyclobacterium jeungdonense TaxID=708087 RepID=A0ABT8CBQ5_9BACT|nr:chaperonin GroEL [Cyclobacterium jeungdonense]MDN3690248.1 chaperonin GroEL [Cyclobacterium jeungdonense]